MCVCPVPYLSPISSMVSHRHPISTSSDPASLHRASDLAWPSLGQLALETLDAFLATPDNL
jgi:hypothetical protein